MSDAPSGDAPPSNGAASSKAPKESADASKNGKQPAQPKLGPDGKPELSNADKKKLKQQEKAARRAKVKEGNSEAAPASTAESSASGPPAAASKPEADKQRGADKSKISTSSIGGPRQGQQHLPVRRRPSQTAGGRDAAAQSAPAQQKAPKEPQPKQVSFLTHLYAQPRRRTTADAAKDVHPTILLLAQQTAHYAICGSQARTVATLLALKTVISTYTTPPGTSLPRHLSKDFLGPQLTHLKSHGRPFCTAQSTAIRWLKNAIATLDPALPEHEAKARVLAGVDTFVRDRFAVADRVIAAEIADHWIRDGDVVLVFGNSAVVARCLREAVRRGRRFRVIVADARPLHEGAALARSLRSLRPQPDASEPDAASPSAAPPNTDDAKAAPLGAISTTYTPLSSLAAALAAHPPTRCLLGAHSVLNDGAVQARAGTALTALLAHTHGAPVLVAAESAKFAERVAVGALGAGANELGSPEALLSPPAPSTTSAAGSASGGGAAGAASASAATGGETQGVGSDLKLAVAAANLLYDVTPPSLVSVLVTELGCLPSGAAPAVLRMVGGAAGDAVV